MVPKQDRLLGEAELNWFFPFHIAFDPSGLILGIGRSVPKVIPEIREGGNLASYLRTRGPNRQLDFAEYWQKGRANVVLETTDGMASLKGGICCLPDPPTLLFIFTVQASRPEEWVRFRLVADDFPPYDLTLDLLRIFSLQQTSVADIRRLSQKLKEQKDTVSKVNTELEKTLAEIRSIMMSTDAGCVRR